MDDAARKEAFSRAIVEAIAAHAGFGVSDGIAPDDDSVDMTIASRNKAGLIKSPRLDIQLKCTSMHPGTAESWGFPLKLKNYDDLREKCHVPRILVVVYVPESEDEWIRFDSPEEIRLRRCAFWTSIEGMPETGNESSVTVRLHQDKVFDSVALKKIMQRISDGGRP